MKVKVSVIIPTYKREQLLVNTIKQVLKQKFSSFELIVVDQTQKHTKNTQDFLKGVGDIRFRYFKVTPPSLPAARNFGIAKALGEVIIYIDDDVILDNGFIKAHFEIYKDKSVVAAVGRIKEKGKEPGELLFFRKTDFGAGNFNYPFTSYAITAQGCNMSFRKNILLKIGGFDTNYIGNALREESDVTFRLRKLGYQTLYSPKPSLTHLFAKSGGCKENGPTFENYIVFQNEFLFFLRHRPWIYFPYFFAGRFFKFVLNRKLIRKGIVWKRTKIFFKGLFLGLLTYIHPKKQIVVTILYSYEIIS